MPFTKARAGSPRPFERNGSKVASRRSKWVRLFLVTAALAPLTWGLVARASAAQPADKQPVAVGTGGAAASVDAAATRAAISILREGGNAIDAAIAAAAVLGVTEPYVAGIGGGGFMTIYLADQHRVVTIDGRETAPQAFPPNAFIDPGTGKPIPFFPQRVTTGASASAGDQGRAPRLCRQSDLPRSDRPESFTPAGVHVEPSAVPDSYRSGAGGRYRASQSRTCGDVRAGRA
jgi:hypothetical protein